MKQQDIGGIVLAGGQSSRMGQEKGLIPFCGKPMIKWVLEALHPLVSELVIVANDTAYEDFGYRVVPDDLKQAGPVAGLCTGLRSIATPINFLLSCDIPLIQTSLLAHLLAQLGDAGAIAAQTIDQKQPLVSIYRSDSLPALLGNLGQARLRMQQALEAAGGHYYSFPGSFSDFDAGTLRNFNAPEDIAAFACRE